MRTIKEWIALYEKKSGDRHDVPNGTIMLSDLDKGFAVFGVFPDKSTLLVYETCGNGVYWYMKCMDICREHGIPRLMTICTREILPYLRLMKGTITEKSIEKKTGRGIHFYAYHIRGVTCKGKPFECFGAWYDHKKQRSAYFVVTEV